MTICREWTLVKTTGGIATAEPLRCRSWGCEICGPERRRQLIAQAIGGNPNTFITLTSNPAYGTSPDHRARMLAQAWRSVRRWFAGKYESKGRRFDNGTLPFLAVLEATKKGEPHLHILCRSEWIDQAELSSFMNMLIGAPVVWIERIDQASKAAVYCAKYCGKEPARFGTTKRYWCSQDYEIEPPEAYDDDPLNPPTFEVAKCSVYDWITNKQIDGWMAWETKEGAIAWNPRAQQERATARGRSPPHRGGANGSVGECPASNP